ncbi:hypothetical protein GGR53DRAFT_470994 [Hypoxylon sp. FL1150]|nr:hypothetical protein GGR53DRAFT_470994 [Hypoxylon sp. FL1150]
MADPSSIPASLVRMAKMSGRIISLCYDYRRDFPEKDITTLQHEAGSLRDIIEHILRLLDTEDEYYLPLLRKTNCRKYSFSAYSGRLRTLENRMHHCVRSKQPGRPSRRLLRANDLTKGLETIQSVKSILEFGIVTDTVFSALHIRRDTRDFRTRIQDFTRHGELSKERKLPDILEWLGAPDPSFRHNELRSKRAGDTGSWLLNSDVFRTWHDSKSSSFLLRDIPGCGKSVLSSTVIEHVRHYNFSHGRNTAIAYYHFDFSDGAISKPDLMLRSLISQLASWNGGAPDALEKSAVEYILKCKGFADYPDYIVKYHDGIAQPTSEDLINILRGIAEELGDLILVIDALDECVCQQELLEHLDSMLSWNTNGLRIFLTSRDTSSIASTLDSKVTHTMGIRGTNMDKDIKSFVQGQLKTHPGLRRLPVSLRNQIQKTLTTETHGVFWWVDCQLSVLGRCKTARDVEKALKALPKTLSETYTSALCSIDEAHWNYAIGILMFLAVSPRPVTIGEVVDVLAIDFGTRGTPFFDEDLRMSDVTDILATYPPLVKTVTIRQLGADRKIIESVQLRLAHCSVKEYLLSEAFESELSHTCPFEKEQEVFSYVTRVCLVYLLSLEHKLSAELLENRPFSRHAAEKIPGGALYVAAGLEDILINLVPNGAKFKSRFKTIYRRESVCVSALSEACRLGRLSLARRLIGNGADVNALSFESSDAWSPLANAALAGNMEIVDLLLRHGIDANTSGRSGPALQIACFKGHKEMAEALIEHGASLTCAEGSYGGPVQAAVLGGHLDILRLLVTAGVDINMLSEYADIRSNDNISLPGSPIQAAVATSNVAILDWLLEHGANVNNLGPKRGLFRRPGVPLAIAAQMGNVEMVHRLLEAGAAVDLLGKTDGANPALFEAVRKGHLEVVECLLAAGANPNAPAGLHYRHTTAFTEACAGRSEAIVEALLDAGADANTHNCVGTVVSKGTVERIRLLIQHGADVNKQHKGGWTALHTAARDGRLDILRALLSEFSADPSLPLENGSLPIHTAATYGQTGCIEVFLHADIEVLLQPGIDINVRSANGRTALHWAAASDVKKVDHLATVEWLLKHGADDTILENKTKLKARDYLERKARKGTDLIKVMEVFTDRMKPKRTRSH